MRPQFLYSALIMLAVVMSASCNAVDTVVNSNSHQSSSKGSETTYADGARRVTIEELETLMNEGKAYVVDVRNQAMYDTGHIPGSRLIPSAEILNHVNELPHNKTIVTYCS